MISQRLFAHGSIGFSRKQGVCHSVALPFTLKGTYLKAKEEL
jgi:hypothetical protein